MPDLPTKHAIVERVSSELMRAARDGDGPYPFARRALDILTVRDLLALLRERGFSIYGGKLGSGAWTLSMNKPDE